MSLARRLAVALCACGFTMSAAAAVTASLDRAQVADGETVQLTLSHDGRSSDKPDLSPLKRDFDILGTSTNSSYQIVNGDLSARVEMQLTLAPRRTGTLAIPPISWDGERSSALEVRVATGGARGQSSDASGSSGGAGSASPNVFLSSELETRAPYVQSAVIYTVRLHTAAQLAQAGLELAGTNEVLVQQLGKDRQFRETREGRSFEVVERQYLLLPQRSGKLKLQGPVLDAQVADSRDIDPFFGRAFGGMLNTTRPLRLHGEAIELDVRPRPPGTDGRAWLPARQVSLEETWQPDAATVKAGEPLTRHLRLSALGLTGAQLPDLAALMGVPDGLRVYPDQAKLDTSVEDGKPRGTREQNIAIIATEPGRHEIPALRLAWWDVAADVQREVVLPARVIEVQAAGNAAAPLPDKPAPATAAPQSPPAARPSAAASVQIGDVASSGPWIWVSLGLGLLWLSTLAAWWLRSRRSGAANMQEKANNNVEPSATAGAAIQAFKTACAVNDAPAARRHLLDWARATWPQDAPRGLSALAQRLGDAELARLLQELDRACYAGGGPWQGESLSRGRFAVAKPSAAKPSPLADLYP
ncbi:MAG: BatD family protein [Panacagrimonas sp.]